MRQCRYAYVTKYLIGIGHENIVTIGSEKEGIVSNTVKEREEGYRAALREAGISHDGLSITVDWKNSFETRKRINLLLDYHKVSAIIVLNNSIVGEVLNTLDKRNLKFPDDLSLITWDDEDHNAFMKITSVRQPSKKMGELAISSLIELIEEGSLQTEEMTITLNQTLIKRDSCKISTHYFQGSR